ncbi:MAG: tRNA (5-methylaminomethyl-2-thiouridine)(34)-methyltransferase MnmD [Bacteroidales bacterium]
MKREIFITEDGSHSLFVPELAEHFHSTHGAVQESLHVFIKHGLQEMPPFSDLVIFEVGFGTGLNALLSLVHAEKRKIKYISLEQYPLLAKEYEQLNYTKQIDPQWQDDFLRMHQCAWGEWTAITEGFDLLKLEADFCQIDYSELPQFQLVYFDAFAPNKQGEMWEEQHFHRLSAHCAPQARFVTYCAQGEVRRKLSRAGFQMHRVPGPPMKREMLVGIKGGFKKLVSNPNSAS